MSYSNLLITAFLSRISYEINKDILYIPKNDEIELLSKINKKIHFFNDIETDAQGIICISNDMKTMYIVIRGTNSFKDFKTDLNVEQTPVGNVAFHFGFNMQGIALLNLIHNNIKEFMMEGGRNIILCGHSIGGSIASIIAYYLINKYIWRGNLDIYTFGMPIFTNYNGTEWFKQNIPHFYSIIDTRDPIPKLMFKYSKNDELFEYVPIKQTIIRVNNNSKSKFSWKFCFFKLNFHYHSIHNYIENLLNYLIINNI